MSPTCLAATTPRLLTLRGRHVATQVLTFVERETLRGYSQDGWPKSLQPRPTVMLMLADSVQIV